MNTASSLVRGPGSLVCTALTALFIGVSGVSAATVTWKSAVSGNWSDGTKWSTGSPPAAGDTAVIDPGGTYTVTVNANATVAGLTVNAASGRATLSLSGGTFTVNGPGDIGSGGALNLVPGGTLAGSGDITTTRFSWTGGQLEGAGKLILPAGATADFAPGGQHNLLQRRIVNGTTLNWTSADIFYVGNGAVLENQAAGVIDLKTDVQCYYWTGTKGQLLNAGTVRKSGGTAVAYLDLDVANSGSFQQNSGTLNLRQGGTLAASWSVGAGATLAFNGNAFTTHASGSFNGAGRYLINGGTFNVATPFTTAAHVELAPGGTLTGAADITFTGRFNWSGGQIEGAGKLILPAGTTADFSPGGQHNLLQRRIVNGTTLNWTSADIFYVGNGAVLENQAAGVLDLKSDVQCYYWTGTKGQLLNAGTVRKSAGNAVAYLDLDVANSGSFQQNSGTLNLRQGGTLAASWSVGAGATLAFNGNPFTTHASGSFNGAGRYLINGGTFNVATPFTTAAHVELAAGGTLSGAADITFTGRFNWSGGQLEGAGKLILPAGSTADFSPGGQHNLLQRRIVNGTTLNWTSADIFYVGNGAVLENQAAGVIDLKSDVQCYYWTGTKGQLLNAGTVRKTAGTAVAYLDLDVANSGSFQQNSGTLNLRQGGTLAASWSVGAGATLAFNGNPFTTHASGSFNGAGRYLINGGTFNVATPFTTAAHVELAAGGTLSGAADITFTGRFNWSGGQLEGAGKLILPAGSTADFSPGGQHNLLQRRIVNGTTINWTSADIFYVGNGAVLENQAAGVVDLKADVQSYYWTGAAGSFQNAGTVRKTAGVGFAYFDWAVQNTGTFRLEKGQTQFRQGFVQTDGRLELAGGNYGGGPALLDIRGGVIEGAGTIDTGLSVAGDLRPGGPLGRLQVTGAWNSTNTAGGLTVIQLGGTNPGADYDQFFTGGSLNLNGELQIEFANGFEPGGADVFEIARGAQRKGVYNATNAPAGFVPELTYTSTNVTLRLIKSGVAAPVITGQPGSLTVDDGQPASFTVTATGSGLTYQWRRNNENIPGATAATYTIPGATFSDIASYTVVVINAGGSRTSDPATLTVNPTSIDSGLISRLPLDGDVFDTAGEAHGLVNGTTTYVDGGARGQALRLNGTTWVALGANPAVPLVNASNAFSVSFWIRPRVQKELVPVRLATPEGEFALYLSSGNNGDYATHFGFRGFNSPATTDQRTYVSDFLGCWTHVTVVYKGGAKDQNASFALYVNGEAIELNARQTITGGTGSNALGNNIGGANGWVNGDLDEVRLYRRALRPQDATELANNQPDCPVEIVQQPVSQAVNPGATATFNVTAIGAQPLTYQWFRDTTSLDGATTPAISILNAQAANAGVYRVVISNSFGAVTSAPVALSINTLPPVIVSGPSEVVVYPGEPASFSVTAAGTGLTYQWRKDGSNINGATGPTYSIPAANASHAGSYSVEVRNSAGPAFSNGAPLWVMGSDVDGLLSHYTWENNVADVVGDRELLPQGEPAFRGGPRGIASLMDGFHYFLIGPNITAPIVDDTRPFAVAFWFRHDLVSATVPVQLPTAGSGFAISFSPPVNGQPSAVVRFGRNQQVLATADPRALVTSQQGCWTHVAFHYKGGATDNTANSELYLNGEKVVLQNAGLGGPSGQHGVGKFGGSNNALEPVVWGGMDDLRIYRRALSVAEVASLASGLPECPPEITSQPGGGSVQLGGILNLNVNAIGRPTLAYQWFRNNQPINGANASSYSAPATLDSAGTYRVEISNAHGTTRSQDVPITITLPQPQGLAGISLGIPNFISGASFLNAYSGCVSFRRFGGTGGGVCITGNGGQSWTVSNVGVTNDINAIQLVGSVSYIAGSSGLLCISTNNGTSWNTFVTGTTANFYGLTFLNSTYGFAVGSGGTICIYNGRTWAPTVTGVDFDFYGTAFAGDVAWAVGAGGAICRYVGGSWQPYATGTSATFYGVSFLNPNFGFAVGSGGTICRYNGTTWVPLNSGTTGTFRSVVIIDALTAYVAGDNGLLCITRDGGNTWEPLSTGGNTNFGALAVAGGRAFLFGAGGTGFSFNVPNQPLNLPPNIRIVSPTNSQQFYACFRIGVSALASDADGSITNVTFYRGQFKMAEITTPPRPGQPYRTSFYTDTFGTYVLRAVATDNRGSVTVSDPVTIEVVPPPVETAVAEAYTDEDGCTVCFMGQTGKNYVFQGTLDLNPPITWVNISTNRVPEPLLRVTDADAVQWPYRFYRFVLQPE